AGGKLVGLHDRPFHVFDGILQRPCPHPAWSEDNARFSGCEQGCRLLLVMSSKFLADIALIKPALQLLQSRLKPRLNRSVLQLAVRSLVPDIGLRAAKDE